ncbi:MAG: hypothetical protein AAF458_16245 [Pseudomonadota bacterium]
MTNPMLPVFLSASIPPTGENDAQSSPSRLLEIREAVREIALAVLPRAPLVFGGHPAINPFVLQMSQQVRGAYPVLIYQSRHFRSRFPADVERFQEIFLTEAMDRASRAAPDDSGDRDFSLLYMRYRMLGTAESEFAYDFGAYREDMGHERSMRFGAGQDYYSAAFFVGGKQGVRCEFDIFRSLHPATPVFPLPRTGHAAAQIASEEVEIWADATRALLMDEQIPMSVLIGQLLDAPLLQKPTTPGSGRHHRHLDSDWP